MSKKLVFLLTLCCLLIFLSSCEDQDRAQPSNDPSMIDHSDPNIVDNLQPDVEQEPEPYTTEATLIAVGDIMMHSPQISGAYDAETGTYSFDSYFTEVKDILSSGDWVIGNLEAPLAGEDLIYAGYPTFNAPTELADALKHAGFNILTTANNHAMDRGEKGVLRTLENLQKRDLIAVGTYASQEEAEEIVVVTKNDISMAILSYTYGVNGIIIPQGKEYLVNLIDEEKIEADIRKAREMGVDLVTVALHMEGEYHRHPNRQQIKLTERVVQMGADIILGSHPHVVQPYEMLETTDELGVTRRGLVIYSLGNFISNQGPDQGTAKYTDVGVIFNIRIQKHFPSGEIEYSVVDTTSTWVHKYGQPGKRQYRILPIHSVITAKNDPLLSSSQYQLLESYLQEMTVHLNVYSVPVDSSE